MSDMLLLFTCKDNRQLSSIGHFKTCIVYETRSRQWKCGRERRMFALTNEHCRPIGKQTLMFARIRVGNQSRRMSPLKYQSQCVKHEFILYNSCQNDGCTGMKMDVRKTYRQIAPSCHHCIFSNLHRGRRLGQRDRFRSRAYFQGGRQLRENICEKIITILRFSFLDYISDLF